MARAGGAGGPWSPSCVKDIYRRIKWELPNLHVLAGMVDRGRRWPHHQASLYYTLTITRQVGFETPNRDLRIPVEIVARHPEVGRSMNVTDRTLRDGLCYRLASAITEP